VFKDFVSDTVGEIRKLGNPTPKVLDNNNAAKQTAGS
jgi:hypothetical protein